MNEGNGNDELRPMNAVNALRARGVDTAEALLEDATPEQILAACRRWDSRQGVGPGLLVRWIRAGEFDEPASPTGPSKTEIMRAKFDTYAARFPEGEVAEPHARLQARRYPEDDPCPGNLVVIGTTYPAIAVECDTCDYTAAYPLRSLRVLDGQVAF